MSKKSDPCFWKSNDCPKCGCYTSMLYVPDLLFTDIDSVCPNCNNTWLVTLTDKGKHDLFDLVFLADRQDTIWKEYVENRVKLGYEEILKMNNEIVDIERI